MSVQLSKYDYPSDDGLELYILIDLQSRKFLKYFNHNIMQVYSFINLQNILTIILRKSYDIENLCNILTVISHKSYEIVNLCNILKFFKILCHKLS